MIRESVTIDQAIELLNEALALDPEAMTNLVGNRAKCNDALADHSTIQVGHTHGILVVGMLGIINGLFGAAQNGDGSIAAITSETGAVLKFVRYDDKTSLEGTERK